ncbi:hypothetical protein HKX48_006664 [Thoreauomyces humboldtii]|nr:hypothetical protein HKX48_006664 [Thoreauomyces humboldtii]
MIAAPHVAKLVVVALLATAVLVSPIHAQVAVSTGGTQIKHSGIFMPEATFDAYASAIQKDYSAIANPSPQLTQAVSDISATANTGPVDVAAVQFLAQHLAATIITSDPSYAPLTDVTAQLDRAVSAAFNNQPAPLPTPFLTVTFGAPAPTNAPAPSGTAPGSGAVTTDTVVQTVQQTLFSTQTLGTATVTVPVTTVTSVTTTTRGGAGGGAGGSVVPTTSSTPTYVLPFQPTALAQSDGSRGSRPARWIGGVAKAIQTVVNYIVG